VECYTTDLMKKITLTSIIALFILSIISGFLYLRWLSQPVNLSDTSVERFIIPRGQAVTVIGERLTAAGLIKHPLVFRLIVRQENLGDKIQSGSFDLSASMDTREIANTLTQGTQDVWITILEGWRAEEIAQSLSLQDLDNFDENEFLQIARPLEGRLFPDTYLIPREISSQQIVNLLVSTFDRKIVNDLENEIIASSRNFEDIIVMASLIEREARDYQQMRHVSGILWNRINIGMALQVDATLQYAKGYDGVRNTWWSPPLAIDKQINSPFNTYRNPGLPPAPISNPGVNAVKAALNPLQVDDLYYLHAPDGSMYFAKTLDGHNANINRYLR
jgi:UPF0755 protein